MSDEYTPTTDDIRVAWLSNNIDATDESPMPMSRWEAEFDAWITAHDREVAAKAWDEGWTDRHGLPEARTLLTARITRNPHREQS